MSDNVANKPNVVSNFRPQNTSGLFGRKASIHHKSTQINLDDLDFEFNLPFDDDLQMNEGELTIYNLTDATISSFKYNDVVSVEAGYKTDTGVIFSGRVSKVTTKYDGANKVTLIRILDGADFNVPLAVSKAYAENTQSSYILRDLISSTGLPIAVFKTPKDHTHTKAITIDSNLASSIQKLATICDTSAYINKGSVYVRPLTDGDNTNILINADTGLIGSPEEFAEEVDFDEIKKTVNGLKIKILLTQQITTASLVTISSALKSGKYRVRRGKHVLNGTEFSTEIEVI